MNYVHYSKLNLCKDTKIFLELITGCSSTHFLSHSEGLSLIPRPSPPPVFGRFQFKIEGGKLKNSSHAMM